MRRSICIKRCTESDEFINAIEVVSQNFKLDSGKIMMKKKAENYVKKENFIDAKSVDIDLLHLNLTINSFKKYNRALHVRIFIENDICI